MWLDQIEPAAKVTLPDPEINGRDGQINALLGKLEGFRADAC